MRFAYRQGDWKLFTGPLFWILLITSLLSILILVLVGLVGLALPNQTDVDQLLWAAVIAFTVFLFVLSAMWIAYFANGADLQKAQSLPENSMEILNAMDNRDFGQVLAGLTGIQSEIGAALQHAQSDLDAQITVEGACLLLEDTWKKLKASGPGSLLAPELVRQIGATYRAIGRGILRSERRSEWIDSSVGSAFFRYMDFVLEADKQYPVGNRSTEMDDRISRQMDDVRWLRDETKLRTGEDLVIPPEWTKQ